MRMKTRAWIRGNYGNNVMKERVTKEESTGVKRQKEETKEEEKKSGGLGNVTKGLGCSREMRRKSWQ